MARFNVLSSDDDTNDSSSETATLLGDQLTKEVEIRLKLVELTVLNGVSRQDVKSMESNFSNLCITDTMPIWGFCGIRTSMNVGYVNKGIFQSITNNLKSIAEQMSQSFDTRFNDTHQILKQGRRLRVEPIQGATYLDAFKEQFSTKFDQHLLKQPVLGEFEQIKAYSGQLLGRLEQWRIPLRDHLNQRNSIGTSIKDKTSVDISSYGHQIEPLINSLNITDKLPLEWLKSSQESIDELFDDNEKRESISSNRCQHATSLLANPTNDFTPFELSDIRNFPSSEMIDEYYQSEMANADSIQTKIRTILASFEEDHKVYTDLAKNLNRHSLDPLNQWVTQCVACESKVMKELSVFVDNYYINTKLNVLFLTTVDAMRESLKEFL